MRWVIEREDRGVRVDKWLARQPEVGSRARAADWIERGKIFVNDDELTYEKAGRRLREGDQIDLWVDRPGTARAVLRGIGAARSALKIVYEDRELLVADKPAGMLVEPLPGESAPELTLLDLIVDHERSKARVRPLVVHRIDRDTSGLVVFSKGASAQASLKGQFRHRLAKRVYLAVVRGEVKPAAGVWQDRLVWDADRLLQLRARPGDTRAKEAQASYRVLEQFERAALMEVVLVTGKRNQIRVQAGVRGYPIVGERIYTYHALRPAEGEPTLARQALHAWRLAFKHPIAGTRLDLEAPVPNDFKGLVDELRRGKRAVSLAP
jgi:23S rRNA pseudouridine1911/1915/1917 synthase